MLPVEEQRLNRSKMYSDCFVFPAWGGCGGIAFKEHKVRAAEEREEKQTNKQKKKSYELYN